MDGTFVEELSDRMIPKVEEINGREFVVTKSGAVLVASVLAEKVTCFSLAPFVEQVLSLKIVETETKVVVNIDDYNSVTAFLSKHLDDGRLQVVAKADFSKAFEPFGTGARFPLDEFKVKLLSMFATNFDREDLLKLTGTMKLDQEASTEDDGVSQRVQVKGGIHLSKEVKVRNPWELLPYKTFPEIEPVTVPYIFRVYNDGRNPTFALYEADGGRWKVNTAAKVREYLKERLKAEHVRVL